MGILLKPFILDVIILFYVMIMLILGYKKGFIVRLYDFVSTFLAALIAYEISYPVSQVWIIYQLDPPLEVLSQNVNQFFIFVIIFVIFKVACKILGIFLKPLLKKILSFLKLTEFLDHLLGVILSFLESVVIIYLTLAMIISPLFSGGKEIIQNSIIAHTISLSMPEYTREIMNFELIKDFHNIDLNQKDTTCVTLVSEILYKLDTEGMMDEQSLKTFIESYYSKMDDVSVDQKTYDLIIEMCHKHQLDDQKVCEGIRVSDENEE